MTANPSEISILKRERVRRRDLLFGLAVVSGTILLAACRAPTSPTVAPAKPAPPATTSNEPGKPADSTGTQAAPKPAAVGQAASGATTDLRVYSINGEGDLPAFQKAAELFSQKNPKYKVTHEPLMGGWDQYVTKLIASTAAGSAPDTGKLAGYMTPAMAKRNILLDQTDLAKRDTFEFDKFFARAFPPFVKTVEGKLWGVPTGLLAEVRVYNKELLAAVPNVNMSTDWSKAWNWEETVRVAKALTKGEGANKVYGLNYGLFDPIWGAHQFWQGGADFYSPDKSAVLIDKPEAVEVIEAVRHLVLDHKTTPLPSEVGAAGGTSGMFRAGRIAIWDTHHNSLQSLSDGKSNVKWDVLPLSLGKAGKPFSVQATDIWWIHNQSKNKDGAWEIVKFYSSEEGQTHWASLGALGIPARKTVAEKFKDKIFFGSNPDVHFGSLEVMREAYYTTNFAEIRKEIMDGLTPVILGQKTAKEASEATAKKIGDLLKAQ